MEINLSKNQRKILSIARTKSKTNEVLTLSDLHLIYSTPIHAKNAVNRLLNFGFLKQSGIGYWEFDKNKEELTLEILRYDDE